MEQAISISFGVPQEIVKKTSMLISDIEEVAKIAKVKGKNGVLKARLKIFRPVSLMLTQTSESIVAAIKAHGGKSAYEYKIDGAGVQIHKSGNRVQVYLLYKGIR